MLYEIIIVENCALKIIFKIKKFYMRFKFLITNIY